MHSLAIVITNFRFGPGGLRAPCMLVCAMRTLAIVITIVQSVFLSFSLFLRLLLFRGISCVPKGRDLAFQAYQANGGRIRITYLSSTSAL